MERIRIHYTKGKVLRYTGTLDVQKIWERTIRRAHLPLVYSQGFHPQARINQGAPLPLGLTSSHEIIDLWLEGENLDLNSIASSVKNTLPPGMNLINIASIPLSEPSLPTQIIAAEYCAQLLENIFPEELTRRVTSLMSADSLSRIWKGKTYDLRPLIESLSVVHNTGENPALEMRLSLRSGATGRPEEVLAAMNLDPNQARIERKSMIFRV